MGIEELEDNGGIMKLIYVGQPYGGLKENEKWAEKTVAKLNEMYEDAFVSPVLAFGDCYQSVDYNKGIQKCLGLLGKCDELILRKDWMHSKGAKIEYEFARKRGMNIGLVDDYLYKGNKIYCLLGHQAAGKDTMLQIAVNQLGMIPCVSDTTREPRDGETPGVSYHYVTGSHFFETLKNGAYLEHSNTGKHSYGLRAEEVDLEKGGHVFVCDPNGFRQIKEVYGDNAVSILIGCSDGERRRRRQEREPDLSECEWQTREKEDDERFAGFYPEYLIVNHVIEDAVEDFKQILKKSKKVVDNG